METLSSALGAIPSLLIVAVGLGFVIFLHELGHFLVAKWAGVHIKAFSIGFPPTLVSYRKGLGFRFGSSAKEYEALLRAESEGIPPRAVHAVDETEYVLSWIPLGGYVSMAGEDPQDKEHASDPRAFHNKPVGARMAIISAGVTMNVILGLACFVYAYSHGMKEMPAIVGAVLPGTPAYESGIRAGDEVIAVDGRTEVTYSDFKQAVAYSGHGQVVHLDLRRPGRSEPIHIAVQPRRERKISMPTVGIYPSADLQLDEEDPIAARPGFGSEVKDAARLLKNARILKVGPKGGPLQEVKTANELDAALARLRAEPIDLEIRRGSAASAKFETARVTLPPNRVLDLGLVMTMGPVAAIAADSPALAAGYKKGDRIVKVRGWDDFDPMRFPEFCYRHVGEPLEVEVRRPAPSRPEGTLVVLKVRPDSTPPWNPVNGNEGLLDVPGLGLAYQVLPTVVAVRQGSPAEGKVRPGDVVRGVDLPGSASKDRLVVPKPVALNFEEGVSNWVDAFQKLQEQPFGGVALRLKGGEKPILLTPTLDTTWSNPDRGLRLLPLTQTLPPQGVFGSIRRGLRSTRDVIESVYKMVRGLRQGRIGADNVAGPIRIFGIGRQVAEAGLAPFLQFLGLLSVNLAVINFLPIPPLDGGQFVFLLAEKIRGRPLPESALAAGMYAGLAFVLCLMAFVLFQDIKHQF